MSDRMGNRRLWSSLPLVQLSCAILCMLVTLPDLKGQQVSQYDVEAAYLYNFGKFVRWPADTSASPKDFDICIMGRDPFGATLRRLTAGDQIAGRNIHERVVSTAHEAAGCAIVYITDSGQANLKKAVAALSGKGELLVSDQPHFLEDGGMIQFVFIEKRVRFEVNLDTATNSHLAFSSELLKVAVKVMGTPPTEVSP